MATAAVLLRRAPGVDGRGAAAAAPRSAACVRCGGRRSSARLDALVRRAGADLAVREWRGGDETSQAHAALAGLGRTRQILLSDTLVDTLRDDEIEVVVAHEIGHHVHGDVWRAAAWRLVALPLTIGTAALILTRLGAPWGAWPLAAATAMDRRPWPARCRGCRCSRRRR